MKTKKNALSIFISLIFFFCSGFSELYSQQDKTGLNSDKFAGKHFCGKGDIEYIKLLEFARRMFEPDPEFPNISMLYNSDWNSMVEGPTWRAWWIQNSYGTTYCALPFYLEPYLTFLQNAQDFWFDMMGDGKRKGYNGWQAPDGALCDCANPDWIIYKQGDGKTEIHDWGIGFAAAGVVLQSELLLISRDMDAINYYLPLLERTANFLDRRRDPKNNLFLAGPAGNLLAPSYAGWHKPDGTYDKAYLAEISITYIAALDRLIELEKLSGNTDKIKLYTSRRELAKKGLPLITTEEGYFLRSIDPDGTKHGVYGAKKHGYLETTPNHDAIAFRIVDQKQANKIYNKIASIPQLRPYKLIIPNYPAYDDMYEKEVDIWKYGTWINGGHWSTCEGRMMMAYSILGKYEDSRQSMLKILDYARRIRMDNPLTDFGNDIYQPKMPINITYDAYAIPAALIRGLFEYIYKAEGLTLIPHIPEGITELQQLDPVRFGRKKIYLSFAGKGEISSVLLNNIKYLNHTKSDVYLPYSELPDSADIIILAGNAKPNFIKNEPSNFLTPEYRSFLKLVKDTFEIFTDFKFKVIRLYDFYKKLSNEGLQDSYEAAHAKLVVEAYKSIFDRKKLISESRIKILPPESQEAADKLYYETAVKLCRSIEGIIRSYKKSSIPFNKKMYEIFMSIYNEYPG